MTIPFKRSSSGLLSETPPVDLRRLDLIAETDEERSTVLLFFFDAADEALSDMTAALRSGNFDAWKEAAHKLRGAALNFGMKSLGQLCLNAEHIDWASSSSLQSSLNAVRDETARAKAFVFDISPSLST